MALQVPPALANAVKRGLQPFWQRQTPLIPTRRIGGPMPWILAIMVTLVLLATGAALALSSLTGAASSALADSATVQIVNADPALRATQARAAAALLRADPGVTSARLVEQEELEALLEPWLGQQVDSELVPIPALIDVRLSGGSAAGELERLRTLVAEVAPDATIDAQAEWLAPVMGTIDTLRLLAALVVLLLAFIGLTAVWLASRNAMQTNGKMIEIVHLLGGDDSQIAQVFQRAVLPDAVIGSVIGFVVGVSILLLMSRQFTALDAGLLVDTGLGIGGWFVLALIPILAVGFSVATARLTVLSALRRML